MITVGIVYFNELKSLKICLKSVYSGSNIDFMTELILVANGQVCSELKCLVSYYESKFSYIKINFVINKNNNIGESRRKIVGNCNTDFLCITDPDCEVSTDWLKNYVKEFKEIDKFDKNISSLCGAVKIKSNFKIFSFLQNKKIRTFSPQVDVVNTPTKIDHSQTSNAFYKVKNLKDVGSFSPAYISVGEDLELGLRLNNNGYTNYSIAASYVVHDVGSTKLGYIKRFFKLGIGQLNPYLGERKIHLILALGLLGVIGLTICFKTKVLYLFLIIPITLSLKVPLLNQLSLLVAICAYAFGYFSSIFANELD